MLRLGPSLAAALLDSLVEQPAAFPGIGVSWRTEVGGEINILTSVVRTCVDEGRDVYARNNGAGLRSGQLPRHTTIP